MKYKIRAAVIEARESTAMSQAQMLAIRKILGLPYWARLPRCSAKSKTFVKKCEESGDYSHSARDHICDECRCKNTAGLNTKGDFYGLGVETGHYGCGWCERHEKGYRKGCAKDYAVEHMRLLQGVGSSASTTGEFELACQEEARIAVARREVKAMLEEVKASMEDFKKQCIPEDPEQRDAIAKQLEVFNELIATNGILEKEELKAVLDLTNMAIVMRSGLTESGRGGPVAMSDDTRFKNVREFAKVISGIALDEFKVSEEGYVALGEISIRIQRMLSMTQRFIAKKDDWEKFIQEFRMIWASLRPEKI